MKKLILISTAMLLVACQQSNVSDAENMKTESASLIAEKEVVGQAANDVNTAATKSETSNLKFQHRLSAERAQVGKTYEIDVDFMGLEESTFNVEFVTSPGLSLTSNKMSAIVMDKIGKAKTQTISLLPQQEGIYFVTMYKQGSNQKPSAIKVIVGNKPVQEYLQTTGVVVEQEDGSKVISMKADEG